MSSAFPILIPLALGAVFLALVVGIASMLKGGKFDAKYSNKLMRLRVVLQLGAILLILLAVFVSRR